MRSTTTIRIDDGMKERIAAAPETADNVTDVFIIDVTAHTVAQVETDYACHAIAGAHWTEISVAGKTVP